MADVETLPVMIVANLEQIGELVSKLIDPNHQGVFGNTLLHAVVEFKNSLKLVQELIDAGANVNMPNFFGITPLHCAVMYRNHSAFNLLIQSGALINSKNIGGNSALHYSISNCMSPVLPQNCSHLAYHHHFPDKWLIRKLLEYETLDINAMNVRGETPLMWAVACKQLDVVKFLLDRAANVNICDRLKRTPLHIASSDPEPNLDIIFELLSHGACIHCFDSKGDSPVDIVAQRFMNSQSDKLIEIFAKLITLMHEIDDFIAPKLEKNSHLSLLLKRCHDELQLMKKCVITKNVSLFEFLFKNRREKDVKNNESEVYKTIVETLIPTDYSMYCDMIVKRIPKFELCKIVVQIAFLKKISRGSKAESCLSLFSNLIISYCLSIYLAKSDIFNIIVALCLK